MSDAAPVSPKYNQILATAEDLFMRYGIGRVTVEEICKSAAVSKMTFYKFFKNKDDLVLTMLTGLMDGGQQRFDEIMSGDDSFEEKINAFILMKLDYGQRISKEFYADFMGYSPAVRELIVKRTETNMARLVAVIEQAQEEGDIRAELDLKFIAFMFNHLLPISEEPEFLAMFDDTEEMTRQWLNFFFYGIMGRIPSE